MLEPCARGANHVAATGALQLEHSGALFALVGGGVDLAVGSHGVIARNPVRDTGLRQADHVEISPLDVEQSRHLLEVAMRLDEKRRTAWGPILTLALSRGMRPGEVLGLQWGDLDLEPATWASCGLSSGMRGRYTSSHPRPSSRGDDCRCRRCWR